MNVNYWQKVIMTREVLIHDIVEAHVQHDVNSDKEIAALKASAKADEERFEKILEKLDAEDRIFVTKLLDNRYEIHSRTEEKMYLCGVKDVLSVMADPLILLKGTD